MFIMQNATFITSQRNTKKSTMAKIQIVLVIEKMDV